ncbi:DUF1272 domain-containing protein [Kitasatospora purpeofusca]|uniref:DUF1272 domain-containing protein n=1 Tax=Kitasatospora purpeofusca TaxID=67352 RepID=UPI002E1133EC|nr:DUF1272 domain-containing protein [Kitasatospora purpeofusca]
MRPICERCEVSPTSDGPASICSYECAFCGPRTEEMAGARPNRGGELVARPRRTG